MNSMNNITSARKASSIVGRRYSGLNIIFVVKEAQQQDACRTLQLNPDEINFQVSSI
jgi:hypothetical protein